MLALLAACPELAVDYNKSREVLYHFWTQNVIYLNPYFSLNTQCGIWHISNIPSMISHSQICSNIPRLYGSNICEILQYNLQLIVIIYGLINVVPAAHR